MKAYKKLPWLAITCSILLSLLPMCIYAQDMERTVIITKKMVGESYSRRAAYALAVTENYTSNLEVDERSFLLSAQNDRYDVIQSLFVVIGGDAQSIFNFTKWVISFADICNIEDLKVEYEDTGIFIEYANWKLLGGKRYYIRKDSNYHIFKKSDIEKIQKELIKYCKKNNIDIDTTVNIEINPSLSKQK